MAKTKKAQRLPLGFPFSMAGLGRRARPTCSQRRELSHNVRPISTLSIENSESSFSPAMPTYVGGKPMKLLRCSSFADYLEEIRPRLELLEKESTVLGYP